MTDPEAERQQAMAALGAVGAGPDDGFDLAGAALLLASLTRPQVGLARYRAHLDEIAADLRAHAVDPPGSVEDAAAALVDSISNRFGYAGDILTYDDLQNANLIRVIDRRKGLPVALGILYIHAARAQGWSASGLNFPGHFLVRLEVGGGRAILDPFHDGRRCDPATLRALLKDTQGQAAELESGHYERVSDRAILLRLQNNVKLRLIQMRRAEEAVGIVEAMLAFAPTQVGLWREFGLLHAHLGNTKAAMDALERYLAQDPAARTRQEVLLLLQKLRRQLN